MSHDDENQTFTDVAALRRSSLASFREDAGAYFARHPEMHSLVLAVSQYFADEAGDAVHEHVFAFPTAEPSWPHRCTYDEPAADGSRCSSCDYEGVPHGHLDSNSEGVLAWSAFCAEWGGGEGDPSLADPVAVARRASDGGVEVELVHEVVRPWLDSNHVGEERDSDFWDEETPPAKPEPARAAWTTKERALLDAVYAHPRDDGPRRVLVDHWLEQGDVRGEFGALSFTPPASSEVRARRDELAAVHGRTWLGPLQPAIPVGGATFARGPFPSAVVLSLGEAEDSGIDVEAVMAAEDWAAIEAIRYAGRLQPFAPTMRGLTTITGVTESGLLALAQSGLAAPIHTLGVVERPRPGSWSHALDGVRTLLIERAGEGLVDFPKLPGWKALQAVEAWFALEGDDNAAWSDERAATALKLLGPKLPAGASLAVGYHFANGARGGVVAVLRAGQPRVTLERRRFASAEAATNAEAQLTRARLLA